MNFFKYKTSKLSLKGACQILVFLLIIFFSANIEASPYFSLLSSAPQSAKYREVQETTNFFWSCYNNIGAISNLTASAWMRVDNCYDDKCYDGGIYHLLSTDCDGSHGEDVLDGDLGWDDSWIVLTGETNITTALDTNLAYCLVGTTENEASIDFGGVTNTVEGDFDFMLINVDNNLRINTTGNFRMGMVLAETNRYLHGVFISSDYQTDITTGGNSYGVDEDWAFFTWTFTGSNLTVNVERQNSTSTNYTQTISEPWIFEKCARFDFGIANIMTANTIPTNMFFDTRCYSRILSDEEINAIKFDGLCELENRGRINYALISDGVDDYIELADYDSTQSISVFATIKPADIANLSIAGKFDYGLNKRSWWFRTTEGLLQISISDDGTSSATHNKSYKGSIDVADGDYHQVGFSYTNNVLKLYVDGIEDTSITKITDATLSGIYDSTVVVTVGSVLNSGVSAFFYNGSIGDLCVQAIATNQVVVCDGANLKPVKAGSKRFSQRNPAPSNCFYDEVTDTYFENDGTGEFGIERNDN